MEITLITTLIIVAIALYAIIAYKKRLFPFHKKDNKGLSKFPVIISDLGSRLDLSNPNSVPYGYGIRSKWAMQTQIRDENEKLIIQEVLDSSRTQLNTTIDQTLKSQGGFFTPIAFNTYINEQGHVKDHYTIFIDYTKRSSMGWPSLVIDGPGYSGLAAGAVVGLYNETPVAIKFLPRLENSDINDPRMKEYLKSASLHEDEHFAIEQDPARKYIQAQNDVHPIFRHIDEGVTELIYDDNTTIVCFNSIEKAGQYGLAHTYIGKETR